MFEGVGFFNCSYDWFRNLVAPSRPISYSRDQSEQGFSWKLANGNSTRKQEKCLMRWKHEWTSRDCPEFLRLIGWEVGESFLNQSNFVLILIFLCLRKMAGREQKWILSVQEVNKAAFTIFHCKHSTVRINWYMKRDWIPVEFANT